MADFGGMVLTKLGLNLLAKGQTGATINITRVAAGAGVWADDTNAEAVTALVDERLTVPIQGMTVQGDGTIKLTVVISNSGLTEGFIFRELGVFATDPDLGEILYAVAYSGDRYDYLPASATTVEKVLDIYIVVGGAQNVTATISPGAVLALKSDIATHDAAEDAHTVALAAHNADASANSSAIAAHNASEDAHEAALAVHEAKDPAHPASKIGFDNATAALPGDPARVQAAIDALATLIAAGLASHAASDPAHAASAIGFDNAMAGLDGAPDRVQTAIEAILAQLASTDRAGLIELATDAEAAALTDAERALTPAALGSLFGQSISMSGYLRLPGGALLQWGRTPYSSASGFVSTVFPVAFAMVNGVVVTPIRGAYASVSVDIPAVTTGFNYYAWSADGTYLGGIQSIYIAIGR